jgi:hypothetical protein
MEAAGDPISSYQIQTRKLGLIVSIQMRTVYILRKEKKK